jgi:WD40 repeat protein
MKTVNILHVSDIHFGRHCLVPMVEAIEAELAFSILGSWNHELPVAILTGHEKGVQSAQFSPDGKRIVTASADKTARVWDAATGKTLATLAGHEQAVYSAQFSPDGTRLVTRSADWTARVWDAATGKALATITGHTNVVWSAQFSPDGTRLVTASADKTAWLWDALPKSAGPPPEWFPDFLRYMAQMRLNSDGELETLKPADWLALRERLRGVLRANANAETPYLRILRKYVRG